MEAADVEAGLLALVRAGSFERAATDALDLRARAKAAGLIDPDR